MTNNDIKNHPKYHIMTKFSGLDSEFRTQRCPKTIYFSMNIIMKNIEILSSKAKYVTVVSQKYVTGGSCRQDLEICNGI